ncbi:MAG: hypothetical protein QXN05_00955 [Acidilobaceae archaeon]
MARVVVARRLSRDLIELKGENGLWGVVAIENLCSTAKKLKLEVVDESGKPLCQG